jgi:hypothetical protein
MRHLNPLKSSLRRRRRDDFCATLLYRFVVFAVEHLGLNVSGLAFVAIGLGVRKQNAVLMAAKDIGASKKMCQGRTGGLVLLRSFEGLGI